MTTRRHHSNSNPPVKDPRTEVSQTLFLNEISPSYNCIVVGAGISGLYAAREIRKKHPDWTIAIAERYKGLGGRTYSYSPPGFSDIHWEMGAGRIHLSHKHLLTLLKEYGLTFIPISPDISYKASPTSPIIPNPFESTLVPIYIDGLQRLPKDVLATHTIEDLLNRIYGRELTKTVLSYYPYRAELNVLRADLALQSFLNGEMSSHEGYGTIQEGFSELIKRMREDCESQGIVILNRHRLLNLYPAAGTATNLLFEFESKKESGQTGKIQLRAENTVILALHKDAVSELPVFQTWTGLQHIQTQPLLRTYALFPVKKGGGVWFDTMCRIVTPELPRYILPINPKKGVLMISYTDGDDTKTYNKVLKGKGEKGLETRIMRDVRRLFPEKDIPNPVFFRSHMWETGCSYWIPGPYDPVVESQKSCKPMPQRLPSVWLCGESWSLRQAWVEGALEQTVKMLKQWSKETDSRKLLV